MKSVSRRTFVATIPLAGIALSSGVRAQSAASTGQATTLFQNVRVFDGKSDALSSATNVLVRGNMIDRVSSDPMPTNAVSGANVIAGDGRTLMPGLIDMHWHTMLVRPTPAALLTGDIGHLNLLKQPRRCCAASPPFAILVGRRLVSNEPSMRASSPVRVSIRPAP